MSILNRVVGWSSSVGLAKVGSWYGVGHVLSSHNPASESSVELRAGGQPGDGLVASNVVPIGWPLGVADRGCLAGRVRARQGGRNLGEVLGGRPPQGVGARPVGQRPGRRCTRVHLGEGLHSISVNRAPRLRANDSRSSASWMVALSKMWSSRSHAVARARSAWSSASRIRFMIHDRIPPSSLIPLIPLIPSSLRPERRVVLVLGDEACWFRSRLGRDRHAEGSACRSRGPGERTMPLAARSRTERRLWSLPGTSGGSSLAWSITGVRSDRRGHARRTSRSDQGIPTPQLCAIHGGATRSEPTQSLHRATLVGQIRPEDHGQMGASNGIRPDDPPWSPRTRRQEVRPGVCSRFGRRAACWRSRCPPCARGSGATTFRW